MNTITFDEGSNTTDMWLSILSHFKDDEYHITTLDNLLIIMTLSLTNTHLRNIITSNNFWVVYNNNGYKHSKHNIYECNVNLCRIIHKISKLTFDIPDNSKGTMVNQHESIKCNKLYMSYSINKGHHVRIPVSTKEIISSYHGSEDDVVLIKCQYMTKCYSLLENDYCTLIEGFDDSYNRVCCVKKKFKTTSDNTEGLLPLGHNINLNMDYEFVTSTNEKCTTIDDTLYDNYIWFSTTHINSDNEHVINIFAQNILTNTRYLINTKKINMQDNKLDFYLINYSSSL